MGDRLTPAGAFVACTALLRSPSWGPCPSSPFTLTSASSPSSLLGLWFTGVRWMVGLGVLLGRWWWRGARGVVGRAARCAAGALRVGSIGGCGG